MITEFKTVSPNKRITDLFVSAGLGMLAALVYGLTVSKGVYPGESAQLMAVYSGIEPMDLPAHPIWGMIVSWLSGLSFLSLPLRLNLFSVLCSVVSVMLMYRLMNFLIHDIIYEEYSVEYAPRVATWAGVVSALAFLFAVPVWQAATRLQYQSFDLMLVLIAVHLLVLYVTRPSRVFLVLFALLSGVGVVESASFIPLAPVLLAFLVYALWRREELSLSRVTWLGALAVAGMCLYYVFARRFFNSPDANLLEFKSVLDVMVAVWKNQLSQLRSGLPRVGWLILLLM
ncbi:MAG: DUF2723 domain-containing protein, partial [bacterium]